MPTPGFGYASGCAKSNTEREPEIEPIRSYAQTHFQRRSQGGPRNIGDSRQEIPLLTIYICKSEKIGSSVRVVLVGGAPPGWNLLINILQTS